MGDSPLRRRSRRNHKAYFFRNVSSSDRESVSMQIGQDHVGLIDPKINRWSGEHGKRINYYREWTGRKVVRNLWTSPPTLKSQSFLDKSHTQKPIGFGVKRPLSARSTLRFDLLSMRTWIFNETISFLHPDNIFHQFTTVQVCEKKWNASRCPW